MIIAVANLKGGCGKSNITVNLACALAAKHTAVIVDADEQGTATFHASQNLLPVTCESWPLAGESAVTSWLRRILALKADYLVIDTPPHVGAVTQAVAGIADLVIVPVTASAADLMATGRALELVRDARKLRKDKGPRCLLVPSRVDTRTISGRELAGALQDLGEPVGPAIHQRAAFVDSLSAGLWVGQFAPNSAASEDIAALATTVKRMRNKDA